MVVNYLWSFSFVLFYRLDIGDGKDIDLKECPRSKLRQQCIKYLGPVCGFICSIQSRFKFLIKSRCMELLIPVVVKSWCVCLWLLVGKQQEREHYEYIVVEGKIIHKQTRNVLDTIKGLKEGKWIFVMSTSKKLYAGKVTIWLRTATVWLLPTRYLKT